VTGEPHDAADLTGRTVVFFHAHPDDESIFTGVTMRRLSNLGARVVLVTATRGEDGVARTRLAADESLARRRVLELEAACEHLGVARLVLLPYRDSGVAGSRSAMDSSAFVRHVNGAARRLAALLRNERAEALVHYDSGGIYGHPDHVAVHATGVRAARLEPVSVYEATVDREYLGAADGHLVHAAAGTNVQLGRSSRHVTTHVTARPAELEAKRRAMRAHASQIAERAVAGPRFNALYGTEWFVRSAASGVLDEICDGSPSPQPRSTPLPYPAEAGAP
jgi:LmbE family N-acetylglucosaminyl deacetylase